MMINGCHKLDHEEPGLEEESSQVQLKETKNGESLPPYFGITPIIEDETTVSPLNNGPVLSFHGDLMEM